MRLQIIHILSSKSGILQRASQQLLLSATVRCSQARALAVMRNPNPSYYGIDPIAISSRVIHSLQYHSATSLSTQISVGRSVESVASTRGRQHTCLSKIRGCLRVKNRIYTQHNCEITTAALNTTECSMQSNKRRRAGCGVDSTWPLKSVYK